MPSIKENQDIELFRNLLNKIPVGIAILTPQGFVYANKALTDYSGLSEETIHKFNLTDLTKFLHPDDIIPLNEFIDDHHSENEEPESIQLRIKTAQDDFRIVDIQAVNMSYEGKPATALVFNDISDIDAIGSALLESETRFRLFFEHAPQLCYMVSPKGIIINVNKAAVKRLGYEKTELIGKHIRSIYAPECQETAQKLFTEWKSHGTIKDQVLILLTKNGERIHILLNAGALRDPSGKILQSITIQQDISEQFKIQQALKESEAKYRSLVDKSLQAIVIIKPNPFRIVFANPMMAKISGYSIDELLGLSPQDIIGLFHPDFRNIAQQQMLDRFAGKLGDGNFEFPSLRKDGSVRWLTIQSSVIEYEGEPALQGTMIDITEQKLAEEAYHKLVDQSRQGLIILQDGCIVFSNPAFLKMTGYSEEEILDFTPWQIFEIIHPDDRNKPLELLQNIINQKTDSPVVEIRGIMKDKQIRWFELSLSIIEYHKKLTTQVTITDIHQKKVVQDIIRKERDRAQQYLELAGTAFVGIDSEQRVFLINRKGSEILGYSEDELVGKNYFDLCIPERNRQRAKELFNRGMAGTVDLDEFIENPIITKDGAERLVLWHTTVLKDAEGKITGILSSGADVTERRVAEEALKASEEKFRSLVEDTADWVWEVDREGLITYSNSAIEDILGYTAGQIIGKQSWEFMNLDDADEIKDFMIESFKKKQAIKSLVAPFIHRDGYTVILEASSQPIIDNQNQVLGYRGVSRDITQRMIADKIVRDSEERYRSLVETSPDGIALFDMETTILFANKQLAKIVGYESPEDILGRSWSNFIAPADRDRFFNEIQELPQADRILNTEYQLIKNDGTIVMAETNAQIIRDSDGNPFRAITITRDITDKKRAERELEDSKARAEFFTDLMVHDLNNINQAILSAFEILIYNPDVSSKLKDQVQLGLEQVERSTALIGRVKKFSGIDNIQPVMQIRDIEPDFQAALETVKQGFPHKIIHLDTNIYPDTFKVLADDLLEDLLFNLIHNAVKFDHRERVNLQVKVHSDENKRFLRLEIIDHGPGIPDDLKERIFARYTQQDSIKAQGSGIGLTLVQRIVGRYSGKVWVEDRVEGDHTKGSKFVLLLPKWN